MYQATNARAVSGLGAYYASKFEQPIPSGTAGLGANCGCSARPVSGFGAVEAGFPSPARLTLAFGLAAIVTWAFCKIDIEKI